jgi:DNA-binding Xre family transcriptional regulator
MSGLKTLLAQRQMKLKDLSLKIPQVHYGYLASLVNGYLKVRPEHERVICDVMGCSPEDLYV